jgi:hypothetical protein
MSLESPRDAQVEPMSVLDTRLDAGAGDAVRTSRRPDGTNAALRAADWLGLAAAPAFAAMALLAGSAGGGPADMLCATLRDVSPLSGMVPMYALMSAFHLAPWLKLIALLERRRPAVVGLAALAGAGRQRRTAAGRRRSVGKGRGPSEVPGMTEA